MKTRRSGFARTSAAFAATIVILIGTLGVVAFGSSSSPSSRSGIERSGPLSTYPRSWTDSCGGPPAIGDATTNVSILPLGVNMTLSKVYSDIVNSTSFQELPISGQYFSLGWVTTSWGNQEDSGPSRSDTYVVGTFLLLNASTPDGDVQANYNVATGAVTVLYSSGSTSYGCGIGGGADAFSSGASLDKLSPAYYAIGDPVKITFYVVDYTVSNLSVASSTSCLGSFTILEEAVTSATAVYNSTGHGGCSGAPIDAPLNPGQSYNQTFLWNQTNDAGTQVPAGVYEVSAIVGAKPPSYINNLGQVYLGTPLQPLDSAVLQEQFYYEGYVSNGFVTTGQPLRIVWGLTDNGQQAYDLQTSSCSYTYKILNLMDTVVFDSTMHSSCGQRQDNPALPTGGPSHESLWNQTDNSGGSVPPGFYRALVDLHVWSGVKEYNLTGDDDFQISAPGATPSYEQISVASSSLSGQHVYASVYANGDLTRLQAYLNGTLVGTLNYNLSCCDLEYLVSFTVAINNTNPIVQGTTYDLVFVGTFQDGITSVSWANPLNPTS